MTEVVIDGFETVEIYEQNRHALVAAARKCDRLQQAVFQEAPVGQARQSIVVRKMLGSLFGLAPQLQRTLRLPVAERNHGATNDDHEGDHRPDGLYERALGKQALVENLPFLDFHVVESRADEISARIAANAA